MSLPSAGCIPCTIRDPTVDGLTLFSHSLPGVGDTHGGMRYNCSTSKPYSALPACCKASNSIDRWQLAFGNCTWQLISLEVLQDLYSYRSWMTKLCQRGSEELLISNDYEEYCHEQ